jgi:hypothetical protein
MIDNKFIANKKERKSIRLVSILSIIIICLVL